VPDSRPGREDASRPAASSAGAAPWTVLFGTWSVGAGLAVVAIAVLGTLWSDPEGSASTCAGPSARGGLLCPGCGITRALAALARDEITRSVGLHPFAGVLMASALAAASSPLLPRALRRAVAEGFARRLTAFNRSYATFIIAFVGFGLLRFLATILLC